jgi:hypothetical protein
MRALLLLLVAVSLPGAALADEVPRKLKGTRTDGVPRLDLPQATFQPLPTVQRAAEPDAGQGPAPADDGYQVVGVVHQRLDRGPRAGEALGTEIALSGAPLASESFSTVVRVRSPARRGTHIEVSIVDPRQRTLLEAEGVLRFGGGDEARWVVDWARTPFRAPTEGEVQIRLGGTLVSSTPIKFAEKRP